MFSMEEKVVMWWSVVFFNLAGYSGGASVEACCYLMWHSAHRGSGIPALEWLRSCRDSAML